MNIDNFNKVVAGMRARGVDATVCNTRNYHTKIKGKVRTVELYPTTGTVNAAPQGKFKSYIAKGMTLERAVERAIAVANHGH